MLRLALDFFVLTNTGRIFAMLKRTIFIALLVVGGLMLNGCANTRQNRTLGGAGIGAVGGGLVGGALGGSTGAIIGAGAGAVGGGYAGHNY